MSVLRAEPKRSSEAFEKRAGLSVLAVEGGDLSSQLLIRVKNSSRVLGSSLNTPNMVLVTVLLFIF